MPLVIEYAKSCDVWHTYFKKNAKTWDEFIEAHNQLMKGATMGAKEEARERFKEMIAKKKGGKKGIMPCKCKKGDPKCSCTKGKGPCRCKK